MAENQTFRMLEVRRLQKCTLKWGVTSKTHADKPNVSIRVYEVQFDEDHPLYGGLIEDGLISSKISEEIQNAGDSNWNPSGALFTGVPEIFKSKVRVLYRGLAKDFSRKIN